MRYPRREIAATLRWVLGPSWRAKMPNTMKTPLPFVTTLLAAVTLSLLAGCNTFKSRARQMSGVYDQLPASEQQRLERGSINVGDTPEMVYIALGNPDERRDVLTADGSQNVWVYKTYWQQYEGT